MSGPSVEMYVPRSGKPGVGIAAPVHVHVHVCEPK